MIRAHVVDIFRILFDGTCERCLLFPFVDTFMFFFGADFFENEHGVQARRSLSQHRCFRVGHGFWCDIARQFVAKWYQHGFTIRMKQLFNFGVGKQRFWNRTLYHN